MILLLYGLCITHFEIADSLMKIQINQKETVKEEHPLQAILEASKKAVIQGSMGVLLVIFVCLFMCA